MNYDNVKEVSSLVKAEKVFIEIFYFETSESLNKAVICMRYAKFLKEYGRELAIYHQTIGEDVNAFGRIEKAQQLVHQYTEDRDDEKLLRAAQIFTEIYNSLEELKDPIQARFHKEFAAFLDKHSRALAFCYFVKSLEYNPLQRKEYSYKHLEELAQEKIASTDKDEQMKGYRTLEWMQELRTSCVVEDI
jgi:hypothetical protein